MGGLEAYRDKSGMKAQSCSAVFRQVDAARNLIYVRGQVPGHKGNFVRISDAALKTFGQQPQRPVPTFLDPLPLEPLLAPKSEKSPFDYKE